MSTSVTTDADHAVPVASRDVLVNELAAVSLALLDKREERTKANKGFNTAIKALEKRQRELATTIRGAPGMRESLQMTFASIVPQQEKEEGEN